MLNAKSIQVFPALLLSLLLACGCSSESGDGGKDTGGGGSAKASYDSPQAAFDAAKAAADKGDWSTFAKCMEPASRDKFAAMVGFMSSIDVLMGQEQGDEGKKKADEIKAVFAKHGITEEMLNDESEPTAGSMEEAMLEFIKPIKDRMAFITDMGAVNGDKIKESIPIQGDTTLSDVKIDGDTATATMTFKMMDQEQTDTIDFKKVDGSWGIELKDGP